MKLIKTEQSTVLVNNAVLKDTKPAYLYELTTEGNITQRHQMILNTILSSLAKKELDTTNATVLDAYSFHNLCISVLGPYITTLNGEQVYTFRNDRTMVKLDPGTKHPELNYHVKFNKGIFSCVSHDTAGAVKSIEYLAILNSGAIRFVYKYSPTAHRMTVLSNKEMPNNVKDHLLLNKVGQQFDKDGTETDFKSTNNPAIGFKLLLDLLDEEETNGDNTNHTD